MDYKREHTTQINEVIIAAHFFAFIIAAVALTNYFNIIDKGELLINYLLFGVFLTISITS
ncbi:MAG: hypothetical protein AB1420_14150 [Bacillota bacterium]